MAHGVRVAASCPPTHRPGRDDASRSASRSPGQRLGNRVVQRMLRPGSPVEATIRGRVEAATGATLAGVRVHDGEASRASAAALGARAYTLGSDIHFGAGEYRPGTQDGDRLIAHELVHTIQQGRTGAALQPQMSVSRPGDAGEREADSLAEAIVDRGVSQGLRVQASAPAQLQRKVFLGATPLTADMATIEAHPDLADPTQIGAPLADAGVGARNVRNMVADRRTRYFDDRAELEDFVAHRTTNIGYVDREKTWVKLPDCLVLGESHSRTTVQDLVDATGNIQFQYEGKATSARAPRPPRAPRDRVNHELEARLPKLIVGLIGVRDLLAEPLARATQQPMTATGKANWKESIKNSARDDRRLAREAQTPAQLQAEYEQDLTSWSDDFERDTVDRAAARSLAPSIGTTLKSISPSRPYDRPRIEASLALEALRYLKARPYFSGPLRDFYKAHSSIIDTTITELTEGVSLRRTYMFRKMVTGRFDLPALIALMEAQAQAEFRAAGHPDASTQQDYERHYEKARPAGADGNDHGLAMEQLRDSYMLASILAGYHNGIEIFGLGDNHRKNIGALITAAEPDITVLDAGTFYSRQYAHYLDRDA